LPQVMSRVRIIVSERFRDSIVRVEPFNDRLMKIVVAAKERLYHFSSAYASQTGCSDQVTDELWSLLDKKTDRDRCFVTDAKVVPYETAAPQHSQHQPLICTLKIAHLRPKQVERYVAPRIKWWRMR
uniref:Integrase catalytic domain-containing protein n=1 Tax=Heligmosomoides polygyrus TaxID=6339 RepID=A0A183G436_HELPZ